MFLKYDSDGSYDSFERGYDSDFEREQYHAQETAREIEEIGENAAREEFEKKVKEAREWYQEGTRVLGFNCIRRHQRLSLALRYFHTLQNQEGVVIFARDVPIPKKKERILKFTKEYLVGNVQRFFLYGHQMKEGVNLDEVIVASKPSPLHFDIEIKKQTSLPSHLDEALLGHVKANRGDDEPGTDLINKVAQRYEQIAKSELSEEECVAGYKVIKDFIMTWIPGNLCCDENDISVLTGCRPSKFSLHICIQHILCDSSAVSMPLVAFEIARSFSVKNMEWVMTCDDDQWESPEGKFRVRALMLETMGEMGLSAFLYKGFDDTPFDEAIYSKNHLLRAAGACKVNSMTDALAPVDQQEPKMMNRGGDFSELFPQNNDGLALWLKHLICAPQKTEILKEYYLLHRWRPSVAFPSKRRWFNELRKMAPLEDCSRFNHTFNPSDFDIDYYKEKRLTIRQQSLLTSEETTQARAAVTSISNDNIWDPVDPDEIFRSEDGTKKPFRFFRPGEFLFHVHSGQEEKTPSAKTFPGGFHCFGCNTTFALPRPMVKEDEFPFEADEITESDESTDWLPDINWNEIMKKKWCTVSAPMGSGKTHQLTRLADTVYSMTPRKSMIVVGFRRFLCIQQAKRLEVMCYLEYNTQELMETPPDMLTICANSLWKLGDKEYDVVVLDECGLVRRHFLNSTVTKVLGSVYNRFVQLIKNAEFVCMLQDGVSHEDIQFYTNLENEQCDNRVVMNAIKFVKPVEIHPIKYTTDCFAAMDAMVQKYKNSVHNGICHQPFMVFCSSKRFASYITEYLKQVASTVGADEDRIKGVWGSLKNTCPFCIAFATNPNDVADQADIIVCTSVVGAGFSISRRFHSFHAFLFTDILCHLEERQFICRLRFVLETVKPDQVRESTIFVEKGKGKANDFTKILSDYKGIRREIHSQLKNKGHNIDVLERTHAQIATERSETRSRHNEMWVEWGRSIESTFEELEVTDTRKKDREAYQTSLKEWAKKHRSDIRDMLLASADDDVSTVLSQVEVGSAINMYRHADREEQVASIEMAYKNSALATELLKGVEEGKPLGAKKKLTEVTNRARKLCNWLTWVYRGITREQNKSMWVHMERRKYNTGNLKVTASLRLGEYLLHDLLSETDQSKKLDYVIAAGSTPFFTGARVVKDLSLCHFLKSRLQVQQGDKQEILEEKRIMNVCLRTILNCHDSRNTKDIDMYKDLETEEGKKKAIDSAHMLVKRLLTNIGLKLRCSNKRKPGSSSRIHCMETPPIDFAIALALSNPYQEHMMELLVEILYTDNLSGIDTEFVEDAIQEYNKAATVVGTDTIKVENRPRDTIQPVIARRLAERHTELAAHATRDPVSERASRMDAANALAILHASADNDHLAYIRQRDARYSTHVSSIREEDVEDDTDKEDNITQVNKNNFQRRNHFVQDQADEADY